MDEGTIKVVCLVMLVIQNAGQSIVITQSRIPNEKGVTYDASLAVLLQEIVKSILSIGMLVAILARRRAGHRGGQYQSLPAASDARESWGREFQQNDSTSIGDFLLAIKREVWTGEAIKMMLPAALYVAQNHLQLEAASNVDATSFAIFSQMKIITTAIFTVTLLGRILNRMQWLCVLGVFCGVVLVQVAPEISTLKPSPSAEKVLERAASAKNSLHGLLYLLASCVLSGFAGVYTEKVLSRSSSSIFASTLQMSLCSMVPAAVPVLIDIIQRLLDPEGALTRDGIFVAFGAWAWVAVLYNVWGGLAVAVTMKFASSLAKSLATSVAVVLTFLISIFWLHQAMAVLRIFGALVVVSSVYFYSNSAMPSPSPTLGDNSEDLSAAEDSCEMSEIDVGHLSLSGRSAENRA